MKEYLKLLRIKHYIKNLLIIVPFFFSKSSWDSYILFKILLGIVCFSFASSSIYIFNDIRDIEKDKLHPSKKYRPIASGKISQRNALILFFFCIAISAFLSIFILQNGILILSIYVCLNILYSMWLKKFPIIDVIILATGFALRIIYGGLITNIPISKWLYLVVITGSLCMGLGKRRNELKMQDNTRDVLKYYSPEFLDKNMYVFITLVIVFYSLWTVELENHAIIWTVPVVIIILMKYSFNIEGKSDGDPVEVLLHDKILMLMCISYTIFIFVLLYLL